MCGICGKINLEGTPILQSLIEQMTASLSHRGPDDHGIYLSSPTATSPVSVALGHRRLSIVDLSSAGKQPMANEDKSLWMVFNGEIYNHLPLRKKLESLGHRFSSQTDCEVILHLYEQEGIAFLKKLNGMFAFALWDIKTQSFYLCRDHAGIKPLVYSWDGQSLTFASEIKSILNDQTILKSMDSEALNLYLTFNYIPAPYTIFNSIKKLNPGCYLMLKNKKLSIEKYWDAADSKPSPLSADGCKKELYRLLKDSVSQQLMGDVPIGAFLSGGIDSSIIVALMAEVSSSPVKTFTIGYDDMPLFDESRFARLVTQRYHTDHHEINLKSRDILNVTVNLLNSFDEPFADSSAIPTFIVSEQTSRHVKVALSGDGGDELFAGYRMYAGEYWYNRYKHIPLFLRRGLIEPFVSALPDSRSIRFLEHIRRLKKFIHGSKDTLTERVLSWNEIFPKLLRSRMLKNKNINLELGKLLFEENLNKLPMDNLNRMLYADFNFSLPSDMLTKVDLMSMKSALEVRVPFLDPRVVELAFKMPGRWKMDQGRGKKILIDTFRDLLPRELLQRPKWGFEIPISHWLKTDLKFLMDEHLNQATLERQGIFEYSAVKSLIDEHLHGKQDRGWQLWNLIVFESWYKKFIA